MEAISTAEGAMRMRWPHALVLILGYVALDWASYIHAMHGLNITPWSPAPALGMAFVLRHGMVAATVLFVAIVAAELVVRDLPASLPLVVLLAALLAAGYGVIGELMRRRFDPDLMFANYRRLLVWIFIVVAGTACVSAVFVSVLAAFEVVPGGTWHEAFTRYWIGDAVGVL
ncbi:MAG: histidine kinase, partial [Betaproteobacteria bacterium]